MLINNRDTGCKDIGPFILNRLSTSGCISIGLAEQMTEIVGILFPISFLQFRLNNWSVRVSVVCVWYEATAT